ncbi:MAG: tetratricopeptide repeat protein [Planctomycetes bacterium]|nr:tetratricopeptide repeat protein [Planctomycetota bacterium]
MIGWPLAILVPFFSVKLLVPVSGTPNWPCPAPFGWDLLLVVHVIMGLPLAWMLAGLLPRLPAAMPISIGFLISVLSVLGGSVVGPLLPETGVLERAAARGFWVLTLQLPWAMLLKPRYEAGWSAIAISAVAAAIVPFAYSHELSRSALKRIPDFLSEEMFLSASRELGALAAAGYCMPSGDPARHAANAMTRELKKLRDESGATDGWSKGLALARLERNRESLEMLQALPRMPGRDRLAGLVNHRLGFLGESDKALKAELELGGLENSLEIIDLLARNAHERGDHREAERIYLDAYAAARGGKSHFAMQMARHYHAGNRIPEALEWLEKAREINPMANRQETESLMRDIRRATPGCLVALWPRSH